jgi:serine/threonine-protein kinase
MCAVYCAEHELTGRQIALKVLSDEHADDDRLRSRLVREARALELSRNRHVVDVLDAGLQHDGAPYVAMEMLEGRSLQGILTARERLRVADTITIGVQLCRALAKAHAHRVVHRDLKPSNVMLAQTLEGTVIAKLIDFGISAILSPSSGPVGPVDPRVKVTRVGEFFGTPEYVAPECMQQFDRVDTRSDLYSLGITLYECLAGAVPHSGTFAAVLVKVFTSPLPDVRAVRQDVPLALAEVIRKALALEPDQRYPDAAAMENALAEARAAPELTIDNSMPKPVSQSFAENRFMQPEDAAAPRRRFARAPYATPVLIKLPAGPSTHGKSEDISEGGLLVITEGMCANGVEATVRFMTPLAGRIVELKALTRWVKSSRGNAAIGLEFLSLPEALRQEIGEYVRLSDRS